MKTFNRATNSASCVQGHGAVRVLSPNPCTTYSLGSLGQSKTGIYRYSVYIFAVPIIMTVDHSAEWDSSEPWLAENMELIDLSEP